LIFAKTLTAYSCTKLRILTIWLKSSKLPTPNRSRPRWKKDLFLAQLRVLTFYPIYDSSALLLVFCFSWSAAPVLTLPPVFNSSLGITTSRTYLAYAKRVLSYLHTHRSLGLRYYRPRADLPPGIIAYSDASFGASDHDGKGVSGYLIFVNGNLISWKSKRQPLTTLSSTECEYVGLTLAAQEVLWTRKVFGFLSTGGDGSELPPTLVFCDNQAAIKMATKPNFKGRTRHISRRFHFIRECIANGQIRLEYKSLGPIKFNKMLSSLLAAK